MVSDPEIRNHVDPVDDRYGLMVRQVLAAREREARTHRREEAQAEQRQKSFGYLVSRMRRAAHFSQEELARRMGTKQSTISRWEAGKLTPSLDTLNVIAQVTGFDLLIGARGRGDEIDVLPRDTGAFGILSAPRTIDPNLLILGYVVDEGPMAELWLVANGTV